MPRPLSTFSPDPAALGKRREPLLTLDLFVVTPLFGGGAIAREVDRERPVSGKSVRGHLRFWWRACRGAQFASVQELFEAEAKIWGSTELPAAVGVAVDIQDKGREWEYDDRRIAGRNVAGWKQALPQYALFPFQPQHNPFKPAVSCLTGVKFQLRLTAPKAYHADVKAAVWAWVMFGGIGARTRRGCGTLSCASEELRASPVSLADGWTSHVATGPRRLPIPILHSASIILKQGTLLPVDAWKTAVAAMREFRQGSGIGRRPGPHRSFWPEPDSIRDRAKVWLRPHHRPEHDAEHYYPRADLGLPIVFKFKDADDPAISTLQAQGDKMTRMASPIILKAMASSETKAVSAVILLNAPHVWDAATPPVGFGGYTLNVGNLNDAGKSILVPPMKGRGATAREAFMAFTTSQWNAKEITLP